MKPLFKDKLEARIPSPLTGCYVDPKKRMFTEEVTITDRLKYDEKVAAWVANKNKRVPIRSRVIPPIVLDHQGFLDIPIDTEYYPDTRALLVKRRKQLENS